MTHGISTYTPQEERANVWSAGLGVIAAVIAGAVLLVAAAMQHASGLQLLSAAVFTASMLALYGASTAYHSASEPVRRARLKVMDHCAIYLLIAGTYTPFTLLALPQPTGIRLFIVIWSLAAFGIAFKLFFTGRFKLVSTLVYIAMGWLAIFEWRTMRSALSPWVFNWIIAGGFCYTLGTVFYLSKKLPYAHAVWHAFVAAGTICHFVAVWKLVVP
ncbi:MAG: hemolysin III family protein [Proteobacteria bacterium]|nr:hemolysin III family protein [Pseudomonadota bacterium]MBS0217968.1 hemolysin III family protein [Pseudomonadota bacterium]